jgi:hypothetical protein
MLALHTKAVAAQLSLSVERALAAKQAAQRPGLGQHN